MRDFSRFVIPIIIAFAISLPAIGGLEVCNDSPFLVNTAVGYPEGDAWISRGWYRIEPGQCGIVLGGNLSNRYYYVHAEDDMDKNTWGGDVTFCTKSAPFTISGDNCAARGFDVDRFIKIDTKGAGNFQFTLTCNACTRESGSRLTTSLPRITHTLSYAGRSVDITAAGKLDVDFSGSVLNASAAIYTDLGDFQDEAGNIIRAQVNHNDDCNYILNVHTVSLSPSGGSLRVYGAAHYEDWECLVLDFGPLGEADAGKHRLFEQNGDVTAYLTPQTDGNNVWISVNIADTSCDGLCGVILDSDWFGPYIRDMILESVPQVVRVGSIRDSLPAALRRFPIRLTDVRFYDRGNGALGLRVSAGLTVPAEQAQAVWELLQ